MLLLLAACSGSDSAKTDDTAVPSGGCSGDPTATIVAPEDGVVVDVGDVVSLEAEGVSTADELLAYLWAIDGDVVHIGASGTWTATAPGTFILTLQVEDSCGYGQDTAYITVREPSDTGDSADTGDDTGDTGDPPPPEEAVIDAWGGEAGLPAASWHGLSVGDDGVVWGATDGGLVRFDPATELARTYGVEDGLQDADPQAVLAHSDGTLWVGHIGDTTRQGEHLSVGTDGALEVLGYIDYTESSEIAAVLRLGEQPHGAGVGDVWMGTNEGVCVYDADLGVFAEHAHPTHPHGYTRGVAFTDEGDIWNGDEYQLSRWRYSNDGDLSPSADLFETLPTWPVEIESPITIRDLAADGEEVWVASSLFGVARVAVGAEAATSTVELMGAPFPTTATAVRTDGVGNTWIGSDEGLFVYTGGTLISVVDDAIPDVQQIAVGPAEAGGWPAVWVATSTGLVRIVGIPNQ